MGIVTAGAHPPKKRAACAANQEEVYLRIGNGDAGPGATSTRARSVCDRFITRDRKAISGEVHALQISLAGLAGLADMGIPRSVRLGIQRQVAAGFPGIAPDTWARAAPGSRTELLRSSGCNCGLDETVRLPAVRIGGMITAIHALRFLETPQQAAKVK